MNPWMGKSSSQMGFCLLLLLAGPWGFLQTRLCNIFYITLNSSYETCFICTTLSRDDPTWTSRRHWHRDCQLKNIEQLGAIPQNLRVFGGWRRLTGGPKGRDHDYPCASWVQRKQRRHLRRSCRTFLPPLCTVLVETVRKTWDSVEKRPWIPSQSLRQLHWT